MNSTTLLVNHLTNIELILEKANGLEYVDFYDQREGVRRWKSVGYCEHFVRIILASCLRCVDSTTEKCLRVSMERLGITIQRLHEEQNEPEPNISRIPPVPSEVSDCFEKKMRSIQVQLETANCKNSSVFVLFVVALSQIILSKMTTKNKSFERKLTRYEVALSKAHTRLESVVQQVTAYNQRGHKEKALSIDLTGITNHGKNEFRVDSPDLTGITNHGDDECEVDAPNENFLSDDSKMGTP